MSAKFFKSTYSGGDQTCVEVAHARDGVFVRDSKYTGLSGEQPVIAVPAALWPTLLDLVLSNEPGIVGDVTITRHPDASAVIADQAVTLAYNADEWDAFIKGVADSEFDRPQ
ncbi:DUF397 domain-containing protein [Nocardia sp. NBC_01327]|uniref:DUF397 domain-containing protein n=1 Tax=Nocardia sp. NBC_01327 TaxID=2903593 RepID=UPI002E12DC8E|nr:DUF397 domain-containing protein [Nocardia sp. NBC_01327]